MKKNTSFSEVPGKGTVNKNYLFRMMTPQAAKLAKPYEDEELKHLKDLLTSIEDLKNKNFIVVGAGSLWYLDISLGKVANYVAIEPLSKLFINKQFKFLIKRFKNIKVINKKFGEVNNSDIPEGRNIFVFIFNILGYIEEPIKQINNLLQSGDIIYISSWSRTNESIYVRRRYFDYLNSFEKSTIVDPEKTIGLCNVCQFPFEKLKYYKGHQLIEDKIIKSLIINA